MSSDPVLPLGDVCTFLNGGTPSRSVDSYWNGTIPWITGADIDGPEVVRCRSHVTKEGLRASATNLVPAGTLLLVTRTSVGKIAAAGVDMCFSQDITAVIPDESRVDKGYLRQFLASRAEVLKSAARGATIKGVTRQDVADLRIPLPPLGEQRRIAGILVAADGLRAKRRESIALLDTLTQSIFLDMFGDPGRNPRGWPVSSIGDLLERAQYGTSAKAGTIGELPVLRMGNITSNGYIDFSDLKYLDLTERERDKYLVRPGDVLFNRTNSPDLVGKSAIFRSREEYAYAGYLIRLRTLPGNNPEYLAAFLNSAYAKTVLRSMCKSIIGMANINAREIQAMRIPVPPGALQDDFADLIQSVEDAKVPQGRSLTELGQLFAALQSRAFRGEL